VQIPIKVTREPYSGGDPRWRSRQEYTGSVFAEEGYGSGGWISIRFSTNPEGFRKQSYEMNIHRRDFKDLARMMMEVDPVEAIKAFGVAMQEVSEASICIRQDVEAA